MKLVQKHFLKGTREFEILGDVINVQVKRPFKEERLTVGLGTLDPEPVINKPYLQFNSRGKSDPLLSLLLNKPNAEEFNAFVASLKQCALEKYNASKEGRTTSQPAGMEWNVYDEPPEFDESDQGQKKIRRSVNAEKIDDAIRQLQMYVTAEDIQPLLSALEAVKLEPQNELYLEQMENAFNALGIMQGAVLTYAPYIGLLLSDDPFEAR